IPFPEPLSCHQVATNGEVSTVDGCSGSINSANLRLRLEPTFHVSEDISVHAQFDVLDNLVLGSTPEGTYLAGSGSPVDEPLDFASNGQDPVQADRNYVYDAIRVKRAWGEVRTPVGLLKFGRMPSHWGLGVFTHGGGQDDFHGSYCYDCDHGDTVDRLVFGTTVPGTKLQAAIGLDWASNQPAAAQTSLWAQRADGQPWDLDDADDVHQWLFVLADFDKPERWDEKIAEGKTAFDWGVHVLYRTQDHESTDSDPNATTQTEASDYTLATNPDRIKIVRRGATAYIPDVYVRLGRGIFDLEIEAAAVYGTIENLDDINPTGNAALTNEIDLLKLGAVARASFRFFDDKLKLGLEAGYASGDEWEPAKQGQTNFHAIPFLPLAPIDNDATRFLFNPNYHVDLILFRELIGTVTNAFYIRPSLDYDLSERFVFRAQGVASLAPVPVSTPGNSRWYGIELDGDIGYYNQEEKFFAGASYGFLIPMGALDHPGELGYDEAEAGEASTAHTFQLRLMIGF
ncbi:MAG: TIGR04551 family protein, partial [Pseudomonadota bacterium]